MTSICERNMPVSSTVQNHLKNSLRIFLQGVHSVQPNKAGNKNRVWINMNKKKETLKISLDGKVVQEITMKEKSCHLVGFGKAVLGMAVQMERILENNLKSGILSVPIGTMEKFSNLEDFQFSKNSVIQIYEGAENNLPDQKAMETALKVKNIAKSMQCNDILFFLISGGGSALLPLPVEVLTLDEKTSIIKQLFSKGANIIEINIVRISLSQLKGGKLAALAKNANKIVSFLLSDVVGDPLDLISSGPTIPTLKRDASPESILRKYGIWDELQDTIKNYIREQENVKISASENCTAYIVGNNSTAVEAAKEEAQSLGYHSFILSTRIEGNVEDLQRNYINLLKIIKLYSQNKITLEEFKDTFMFSDVVQLDNFLEAIRMQNKPLCIVLAGEPTVHVQGKGLGGRNQEVALRMSLELYKDDLLKDVIFLSAGTDGIDGPTNAAGAFGSAAIVSEYLQEGRDISEIYAYLQNSDSYNFYKNLNDGEFHVITGHTGTNVMDLHIIIVPF